MSQNESRDLKVLNKFGIHARPAALFVKTAGKFRSTIEVEKEGVSVSGKSIMGLLTLEGHAGSVLRVSAEGEDAREALDALEDLVASKFNEE
jgi:phosphocarrier protein